MTGPAFLKSVTLDRRAIRTPSVVAWSMSCSRNRIVFSLWILLASSATAVGQNRYATSDNHSGYVHWIELYDASNRKVDPDAENPQPYSPEKTCGRCHEYDTISHGWHFDAVDADARHGRPGQPWIWSDERTGTHLPLSYRGWQGTHHPDSLGLSRWEVVAKLGGYMPGGGVGSAESLEADAVESEEDRSSVTGPLPVDCMICHRNSGSGYSPFVWTEQIEDENFPYAPTAALGLAVVKGNMARLKDDFDPSAEGAADKLPTLEYESSRFRSDGKVFFDLVRKPKSDACYYCHTNMDAEAVQGSRWLHDEDIHVRAGLQCADCHRNGLDHRTVRGFEGEQHPAGSLAAALSCQGCHMGTSESDVDDPFLLPGRMGAPKPAHRGLPPIHFEKMTCTACHSGPIPGSQVGQQVNSIAHHLGHHVKRTGKESPAILAAVNLPAENHVAVDRATVDHAAVNHAASVEASKMDGGEAVEGAEQMDASHDSTAHASTGERKYTPHRMMWPSFWGIIAGDPVEVTAEQISAAEPVAAPEGEVTVLNPEEVYSLVRRTLKVRREFTEELAEVKLSLSQRKAILGEERARVKEDDRTSEEQKKIAAAEEKERERQVAERMASSLAEIEEAYPGSTAFFASGGTAFIRSGDETVIEAESAALAKVTEPYAWPLAHNVRPAQQSLGVHGCTECHSDDSNFFQTKITPVGVLPDQVAESISAIELQQPDAVKLSTWNQMFAGRSRFKVAGLAALGVTCLLVLSAMVWNASRLFRR